MRKGIIILFSILFAVNFALAQNTATTTQTGSNNNAIITQTGGAQVTTVDQNGNTNSAIVTQFTDDGMDQTVDIDQDGNGNKADVRQKETGPITQSYTIPVQTAIVKQYNGNNNVATIRQDETGDGNKYQSTAYIEQIGSSNKSFQKTSAPGHNSGQHVWGKQEGYGNDLNQQILIGDGEDFSANQKGNYNKATQYIPSGSIDYHANSGQIIQDGDHNTASQYLQGANNGYSGAPAGGPIKIEQKGNWNTASQKFVSTGMWTSGNSGYIYQEGNGNKATQDVNGWTTEARAEQWGNNNESQQFVVNGGVGNITKVRQDGNSNFSRTYQDGDKNKATNWIARNGNRTYQTQEGNRNNQRIEITGNNNYVNIDQKQDDNKAYINLRATGPGQIGSGIHISNNNDIRISQDGLNNLISGAVTGNNNVVRITQKGNDNIIGTGMWDADGLNIYGHNNTAIIKQLTSGNNADVYQLGNGNTANIVQQ